MPPPGDAGADVIVDKLDVWHDPRVERRFVTLGGSGTGARKRRYGYLYGEPTKVRDNDQVNDVKATLFLIHGFPDLSMGWRYQIPMFLSMGIRVIAPDCMGYGMTDAPEYTLEDYSFKRISDDVAELAAQLGCERIIVGGHDWGGAIVYRMALYQPTLITHVFSICTPYFAPSPNYLPLHQIIATRHRLSHLGYQIQLASGEVEDAIQSCEEIKQFLNGMYGGKKSYGGKNEVLYGFDAAKGVLFPNLARLEKTVLLSERELEYYTQEYARHGVHGPLNWYRTREVNWRDEWERFFRPAAAAAVPAAVRPPPSSSLSSSSSSSPGPERTTTSKSTSISILQSTLFVLATRDQAIRLRPSTKKPPHSSSSSSSNTTNTDKTPAIPNLTQEHVDASHWALWEKPAEINAILKRWFDEVVFHPAAPNDDDDGEGKASGGGRGRVSKL